MLARVTNYSKIFLEKIVKRKRFCERSGLIAFEEIDHPKLMGITTAIITTRSWFPINTKTLTCMRLFFDELEGYRIPQLCLYPPQTGYPLCAGAYSSKYAAGGAWPRKINRYFVTVPLAHIGHGMYNTNPLHQYSVFFSSPIWSRDREYNMNIFDLDEYEKRQDYNNSGIRPYNEDINNVEIEGSNFAMFPRNGIPLNLDPLGLEFDHELCFMEGGPFVPRLLSNTEFKMYLAWWMLYYPHKWMVFKNPEATSIGGENEPFNGYLEYLPHPGNSHYYGKARVYSHYYGTKLPLAIGPDLKQPEFTDYESVFSWEMSGLDNKEETYDVSTGIDNFGITAMANIRAKIESDPKYKTKFKYFPFRKFKQTHGVKKTFITKRGLKTYSTIMQLREHFQQYSQPVEVKDHKCPKCYQELIVPAMLTKCSPNYEKLVCLSCGYKYLMNLFNAFKDSKKYLCFPHYPISEVTKYKERAVVSS